MINCDHRGRKRGRLGSHGGRDLFLLPVRWVALVYFRTRAQGEDGSTGTGKHGHRSKGAVGGEVRVMSEECIETLFGMVRQGMKQGVYSEIFVNIGC